MNTKIIIALVLSICLGFSLNAFAENQGGGNNVMVLNLIGTGSGEVRPVPDIDGDGEDDTATCFTVELFNAKNGRWLGHADDCLSMIVNNEGSINLVGTTYFYLPQGTLITRGETTVQPVTTEIMTPATTMPHITGATGTGNAILAESSGRFMGQTGTVRLSGMVDMSDLDNGNITFDCLFVIALD